MSGRPRLPISTFGSITVVKLGPGRFRATTVFRDWDGRSRQVGATREDDTWIPVDRAERLHTSIPRSSLTTVPGAGHLMHPWPSWQPSNAGSQQRHSS